MTCPLLKNVGVFCFNLGGCIIRTGRQYGKKRWGGTVMNKELRAAYSAKEKAELLLSNLDKLKAEGSIEEAQYEVLKTEYIKMGDDAMSKINSIKVELQKQLDDKTRELDVYKQELSNLEARFKVGQIPAETYLKQEKRLRKKIAELQKDETVAKKNWFKRHLNWTLVLSLPCGYFVSFHISHFIWIGLIAEVFYDYINRASMGPFLDVAIYGTVYTIWFLVLIPITLWYLRQKGRSWHYVFLLAAPFGALFLLGLHNLSEAEPRG